MRLFDVSQWEKDEKRQASGTRQKFWLIHPEDNRRYLFKIPKENTGEAWAEVVASKVGQKLGLNMMKAELAIYNGILGILSENFIQEDEEFYEGGDLFFTIAEDFDRYSLKYYNFDNIIKVLSEFNLNREFIPIPVFDAFIANQDRHCDNWGVIVSSFRNYDLAPIYDNGASLGYQLQKERILKMFQDQRMFEAFTNRSFSLIGLPNTKKPKYRQLLGYIYELYPQEVKEILERINEINKEKILDVLNQIPDEAMCIVQKEWVLKLLQYRNNGIWR